LQRKADQSLAPQSFKPSLLLLRCQHHDHLPAFELGHVLHQRDILQLVAHALQQTQADVLVGDLTATEPQRHLALVTVFQKTPQVAHLDLVVALISTGTELDFLDVDDVLLGLGFRSLLLLLVLELAVVHQPANGWHGGSRDLHQIHVVLCREAQCLLNAHDTEGLVLHSVQAHFRRHDLAVEPMLALRIRRATVKKSSDGAYPPGRSRPMIQQW